MSVDITILPEGQHGLVAQGTYLLDAARRLGVRIPSECGGLGECDTCAIVVQTGATLLSSLTEAERQRLSPDRLASGERLACQSKLIAAGELVVRLAPVTERAETTEEVKSDIRKEFRTMPLDKKLSTLVELEAVAAYQTLSALAELPSKAAGKLLGIAAGIGKSASRRDRESRIPEEHRNPADRKPGE